MPKAYLGSHRGYIGQSDALDRDRICLRSKVKVSHTPSYADALRLHMTKNRWTNRPTKPNLRALYKRTTAKLNQTLRDTRELSLHK